MQGAGAGAGMRDELPVSRVLPVLWGAGTSSEPLASTYPNKYCQNSLGTGPQPP